MPLTRVPTRSCAAVMVGAFMLTLSVSEGPSPPNRVVAVPTLANRAAAEPVTAPGVATPGDRPSVRFASMPGAWLALHPAERMAEVNTLLAEAAERSPDEAVLAAIRFCDEDASYSLEYGRALIAALAKTGDFRWALRFVLTMDADGWVGENGHKWLGTLFTTWADSAPEQAAQAAQHEVGPGLQAEAVQTVAAVWSRTDPIAATRFARQLLDPAERRLALAAVLGR